MAKTTTTRPATEVVAEALDAHRKVSVGELAEVLGLGNSTVSKALAALEADGAATRSPGGRDSGRRLPDRWSARATDPSEGPTVAGELSVDEPGVDEPGATTEPATTEPASAARSDRERLGKGALGDLVLAHLAASPSETHGPVAIAKALGGRSSGAVGNALQRLCDQGAAVLVSDSPRRYRFADGATAGATSPRRDRASHKASGRRRTARGAA